jgi:hypothetical protein
VKKEINGCPRMHWDDELLNKGKWNCPYKPIYLTSLGIIIIMMIIIIIIIRVVTIHVHFNSSIVLNVGTIFAASVLVMRIIRSLYYQIIVSSYELSYALMTSEVFLSNYVARGSEVPHIELCPVVTAYLQLPVTMS